MTISRNRLMIVSWWHVFARSCAVRTGANNSKTTTTVHRHWKFDGQTLELTGTEFTLLYLLAQHLGQVVSREHLSQEVLGKRLTPFDRAIDMHISNLRRKLPDRKDGHPWFKTLRGRGYLMVSAS